jgi:hypothetical protein
MVSIFPNGQQCYFSDGDHAYGTERANQLCREGSVRAQNEAINKLFDLAA